MSDFQPPPTWALPVVVDPTSGASVFNPIWLRWFLDFSRNLTSTGTPTPGIVDDAIAAAVFAPRPATNFGLAGLETNFNDIMQSRVFESRSAPAYETNDQQVLQDRMFNPQVVPPPPDNYENVVMNQVFARRDGSFYALSSIDNVQGALFNKMFGA